MKNYKDKEVYLGDSDIARLSINCPDGLRELNMGGDGSYFAHIVNDYTAEEIPSHYTLKATARNWAWVYDDCDRTASFEASSIEFYRAGDYGILINLINEN